MRLRDKLYFYKGNTGLSIARGAGSCNTIVLGSEKLILIDPGESVGKCMASVKRRMRDDGLNLKDVQLMLFTHVHFDHANAAGFIQKESNCEVRTHPYDVASIETVPVEYERIMIPIMKLKEFPRVPVRLARFLLNLYIGKRMPAKTSEVLKDGEVISHEGLSIQVIFTPGHAMGHVTYYIPEYKALIAGDSIDRGIDGTGSSGGCINNTDSSWEDVLRTLHLLERYDVEIYISGHGNPVEGKSAVSDFITQNIALSTTKLDNILNCVSSNGSYLKDILRHVYPRLPFTLSQPKKIETYLLLQYLSRLEKITCQDTRRGNLWKRNNQ